MFNTFGFKRPTAFCGEAVINRSKYFSAVPARAGDCPFFCEKKEAQRSGKGTALVPFQTPTKFRCRKRCGTTALVNPPAGNLCAAVQSARSRRAQNNLLRGRQFTRRRLRPPLSFAHFGVSRSKLRGSRGCNPLPVFAYFLLGRKYEPVAA